MIATHTKKERDESMAVEITTEKVQAKVLLNNGQDSSGITKTVTVSLPTLSPTATPQQIIDVVGTLLPCLTKTAVRIQRVVTEELDEE